MEEIQDIIAQAEQDEEEIEKIYLSILQERRVIEADKTIREYQKAVSQAHDGKLTNDQIRYFLINFGHSLYILGMSLARQGLASDLTRLHFEEVSSIAFSNAKGDGKRKPTREDKQAEATLQTRNEALVSALYERSREAIEQRIRSINVIMRTLETIATMNMSEAKLGRHQ